MARTCSRDWLLLRALRGRFLRGTSMQDRDMCVGPKLVLAVDDDVLIGLQARVDERLAFADLRYLERADSYGAVSIDHIGVGALRALLHDRRWNCQAVMPGIEEEPCVDEQSRPQ